MSEKSSIEWTDATFNPVWGCSKVSPGCTYCYAEAWAKRTGHKVWGEGGPRRTFGDKHWAGPLKWNEKAKALGRPFRVFCASMADVFEDHPVWETERPRLFRLIEATPNLTWLLLTKRPENINRLVPHDPAHYANVWWGTTVEDQKRANERIPHLLSVANVRVRFLSCEPLLEAVNLRPFFQRQAGTGMGSGLMVDAIHWVICGGESGGKARPFDLAWALDLKNQCASAGAAFFMKQVGSHAISHYDGDDFRLKTKDRAGGDPSEWNVPDLQKPRARSFPEVEP